jgi:PTH2 family peptidyl-tRNA hydrolase
MSGSNIMTHKFLYKQVIVVREDLKMSPGKLAVQVAHASVGAIYNRSGIYLPPATLENWFNEGFRKIVLKAKTTMDLLDIQEKCIEKNIPHYLVRDFGLTELDPNTITCIGIGPDLNENVDKITGRLGLWR